MNQLATAAAIVSGMLTTTAHAGRDVAAFHHAMIGTFQKEAA
ncbi:hypothetical protein [Microbacterium hominis]|nr:hypothetical protein [Microbacterium hominis]